MATVKVHAPRIATRDTRSVRPPPHVGGRGPKITNEFYGRVPWKNLMREIIRQRGRQCENQQCKTPDRARGKRLYGDHIIELQDGGEALNPANVQLLCASCHSLKTADAKRQRG